MLFVNSFKCAFQVDLKLLLFFLTSQHVYWIAFEFTSLSSVSRWGDTNLHFPFLYHRKDLKHIWEIRSWVSFTVYYRGSARINDLMSFTSSFVHPLIIVSYFIHTVDPQSDIWSIIVASCDCSSSFWAFVWHHVVLGWRLGIHVALNAKTDAKRWIIAEIMDHSGAFCFLFVCDGAI